MCRCEKPNKRMFGPNELVNRKVQQSLSHPKQPDTVGFLSRSVVLFSTPKFKVRRPKKNNKLSRTLIMSEYPLQI